MSKRLLPTGTTNRGSAAESSGFPLESYCMRCGVALRHLGSGSGCPQCSHSAMRRYDAGTIVVWLAAWAGIVGLIAWRMASWSAHHGGIPAGIQRELLGLLPLAMLFGPPLLVLFLLWRWIRA